ncbi:TPA: helix-turn-helix domain-containing protein [Vibrio parahaemolyticus]|uniref:Helix-turn-helix transcriptional regulator n=1 Tax=Vibrio parahaemolyticus TaxID=670 RepID=A0AAW8PY48_VIBPH|nr:helix-turn-helix transcriptional regulator [Vibrio parahaemolyticus]MDS1821118.1 helix-turn-helix transcriptional regulator [Vibrio parahaemolyticus]
MVEIEVSRERIGEQLAAARKTKNMTQAEAAEKTGIVATTISKIENGRFTGSFRILERYAEFLGFEFTLTVKEHRFPSWDELDDLFKDDD